MKASTTRSTDNLGAEVEDHHLDHIREQHTQSHIIQKRHTHIPFLRRPIHTNIQPTKPHPFIKMHTTTVEPGEHTNLYMPTTRHQIIIMPLVIILPFILESIMTAMDTTSIMEVTDTTSIPFILLQEEVEASL